MAKQIGCFVLAVILGVLLLGNPKCCEAKTAKTCPNCACVFLDAAGKQSATPVPILIRPGANKEDDSSFVYEVKSAPAAKKPCQGKTCDCRLIKRTTEVVKGVTQVSDQVVFAGKGDNSYRLKDFK